MVADGAETILGMQADPQFGPLLVFGFGGIFVEVCNDGAAGLASLSLEEARSLPQRLKARTILEGARGHPAVDDEAFTDMLLRFSTLVHDLGDLLAEVDINPLRLDGQRCVAVDAPMVPRGQSGGNHP